MDYASSRLSISDTKKETTKSLVWKRFNFYFPDIYLPEQIYLKWEV